MNATTKKLRSCSAHYTETRNDWGETSYTLTSYSTDVCMIGRFDGEIINCATGEIINADGQIFVALRNGAYDCSITTMSHVRKFLVDVADWNVTIAKLREIVKYPEQYHVIVLDW